MATPAAAAAAAAASAVGGMAAWGCTPGTCCAGNCSSSKHVTQAGAVAFQAVACLLQHVVCSMQLLTSLSCSWVFEAPPNSWLTSEPTALDGPAPSEPVHMSEPVTRVRRAIFAVAAC
jgi:hypothetical protein